MKKSFVPVILFAITFFFLILNSGLKHSIALSPEPGGTIQGKFIWADNTPVTECKVKIFNKIETFRGMNTESFLQSVQNIRISKDAKIEETSVDPEGKFKFINLPAGNYYIFFKAKGTYQGNDWSYRYHQPANVLYLAGHQEVPEKYELKDNGNLQVKDFELTRLLKPEKPKIVPGKPGIVRFQWPEPKPGMTSKITIENEEYFFKVKYPLKIEKEMSSNSFQITETEPLVPGKHRFRVTIITPSHHKYAQSKWMNFIVPGEVYHLNIKKIKEDSAGTTLRWSGSPAIKFLRIASQNGSFNEIKGDKVINLPPYGGSQNPNGIFHFYPLNAEQKELIPGWHKFYSQKKSKAASR
jgi:hypothetical protein